MIPGTPRHAWRTLRLGTPLGALVCFAVSFLLLVACGAGASLDCDSDDPTRATCVVSNASLWSGFNQRRFNYADLQEIDFDYTEVRSGSRSYSSENHVFTFRDGTEFALYPRDLSGVISTIDDGQLRRAMAGKDRIDEGFAISFGIAPALFSAVLGFMTFVILLFWGPEWITLDWARRVIEVRRYGVIDAERSNVRLDEVTQFVEGGGVFAQTGSGKAVMVARHAPATSELPAMLRQAGYPVAERTQEQTNRLRNLVGNLVRMVLLAGFVGSAWIAMVVALTVLLTW
jgi:hypothetical protein